MRNALEKKSVNEYTKTPPPMPRLGALAWLCLLLLAGCASANGPSAGAPVALPAGEDALAVKAVGAPPLRPSLGGEISAQPERIQLPAIGVDTDVVTVGWQSVSLADGKSVSQWEVADFAAGWHKNSALPGEPGNVVISGHNNIRGAVFRKLYTLQPGDRATLWAGGQPFEYAVEEVLILEEGGASPEKRRENARWIQPFDDERLTLVSCWPEESNSHRVIVVAKPVGE